MSYIWHILCNWLCFYSNYNVLNEMYILKVLLCDSGAFSGRLPLKDNSIASISAILALYSQSLWCHTPLEGKTIFLTRSTKKHLKKQLSIFSFFTKCVIYLKQDMALFIDYVISQRSLFNSCLVEHHITYRGNSF